MVVISNEPKTDVVAKIARLFNISMDYLVLDGRDDLPAVIIGNRERLQWLPKIDQLPEHDRGTIKEIIDAFILKNRNYSVSTTILA
ncbi:MAG: hypothetical protein DSY58_08265 [Desulfobulbus sp.]|nr:MAG: hypothetical protein DSY58_08265 [Desulfobulbus sp.]